VATPQSGDRTKKDIDTKLVSLCFPKSACRSNHQSPDGNSKNSIATVWSKGDKMDSAISDLALDLGVFALDNEIENERTLVTRFAAPTNSIREEQPVRRHGIRR
jgi:hypothetical protein